MGYWVRYYSRSSFPPVEEYYYAALDLAKEHFNIRYDDDKELYSKIELTNWDNTEIISEIIF